MTKNTQTTTILYYTFFLPGIVLYEVSYWLVAGILDVRAERAISWPEAQEVAELKLSFVRLHRSASPLKVAIISVTPLLAGMAAIAAIATLVLNVQEFASIMQSGNLEDVTAAFKFLAATPDFWLWIYLAFAISNTMMPDFQKLKGFRIIFIALAIAAAVLIMLGAGNQTVVRALSGPVTNGLNTLSLLFAIIIGIDILMVIVLGAIENSIERVTGDSAMFRNGKLIAMRRSEALALRTQQAGRASRRSRQVDSGPPTIYKFPLPIPGTPGEEPITRRGSIVVETEAPAAAVGDALPRRQAPTLITGSAQPADTSEKEAESSTAAPARPQIVAGSNSDADKEKAETKPGGAGEEATSNKPSIPARPAPIGANRPAFAAPQGQTIPPKSDTDPKSDKEDSDQTGDKPSIPARPSPAGGSRPLTTRPPVQTPTQSGSADTAATDRAASSGRPPMPARPSPAGGSRPLTTRPSVQAPAQSGTEDTSATDGTTSTSRPSMPARPAPIGVNRPMPTRPPIQPSRRSKPEEDLDDQDDNSQDDQE